MSLAATTTNYKWGLVGMLFLIGGLNYADRTAISSVFPLLRAEFNATDVELGAIGTVFLWAYAVASPLAGSVCDRISRSRAIVFSLAAWSLITLITGFATSMSYILISRAVLGFAEALYLPAAIALIADYHSSKTRASAIALHTAGLTVGLIAGGTAAGYLGEQFGWRLGFQILGAVGLLLAFAAHLFLKDAEPTAETPTLETRPVPVIQGVVKVLSIPSCVIIFAQAMIVAVGTWIFLNWLPLFFKEAYGLSLAAAGFTGAFMLQGAGTLGLLGGGYLSDKFAGSQPRRRMLLQTLFYLIAAPFLLTFIAQPPILLLNGAIFMFSFCSRLGTTNETPLLCDLLPIKLRSTAIGLMNAANCFAGGLGVMIAGFLKSAYGLHGVFAGLSVLMFVGAILTTIGYRFFLARDLARREQPVLDVAAVTAH